MRAPAGVPTASAPGSARGAPTGRRLRALRMRWIDDSRFFPQMLVAPVLVSQFGPRAALVAVGLFLPVLVLASARRLQLVDDAAAPPAGLALLQAVPIFRPLSVAAKEHVAARFIPIHAAAGARPSANPSAKCDQRVKRLV